MKCCVSSQCQTCVSHLFFVASSDILASLRELMAMPWGVWVLLQVPLTGAVTYRHPSWAREEASCSRDISLTDLQQSKAGMKWYQGKRATLHRCSALALIWCEREVAAATWARPGSSGGLRRGRQENGHGGGGGDWPWEPGWGERSCFRQAAFWLVCRPETSRVQQWLAIPGAAPKMDAPRNCTGASVAIQSFIEIPGGSCVHF